VNGEVSNPTLDHDMCNFASMHDRIGTTLAYDCASQTMVGTVHAVATATTVLACAYTFGSTAMLVFEPFEVTMDTTGGSALLHCALPVTTIPMRVDAGHMCALSLDGTLQYAMCRLDNNVVYFYKTVADPYFGSGAVVSVYPFTISWYAAS